MRVLQIAALAASLWQPMKLQAQNAQPCSSAVTTAAMLNCANVRYEKAQQDLNAAYQSLLKKQDAIGKNKLRAAQTAWLQFRQANADFLADAARGGTLAPVITITTLMEMTEARVKELQHYSAGAH